MHDRDFYCLNYLHPFRTENEIKKHKNVCKNHEYCNIEMSEKDENISKYNTMEKNLRKFCLLFKLTQNLYLKK